MHYLLLLIPTVIMYIILKPFKDKLNDLLHGSSSSKMTHVKKELFNIIVFLVCQASICLLLLLSIL